MSEQSTKVALITGAARRIGAEIARTLHAANMRIVLHYYASEEEALKLCDELNKKREQSAVALRLELRDEESARHLIREALKVWGQLDVLVNNASRFYRTPFGEVTEYAWDDLMNSNVKLPFLLAQAANDALRATEGVVINITDIHAETPLTDYSAYCISKSALLMATKVLAKEMGPKVRVNAVAPGSIVWPEGNNSLVDDEKQKIISKTALKRSGEAADIAKAVLFFVKDAMYVTGQVISIDGGRNLSL